MLFPNLFPHFLARQDSLRAKLMQVNKNQMSYTFAKLSHRKVIKFFSIFSHHFICDVVILIIAEVFQILFIDVTFTEFPYCLCVLIEKRDFRAIFEKYFTIFSTFLLTPYK